FWLQNVCKLSLILLRRGYSVARIGRLKARVRKERESIVSTVSVVSPVLATESLRTKAKNAEERQISSENQMATNENVEMPKSTSLSWNKLLQSPSTK
ncbi:hypothetical protein KI387_018065, partial [Taxus chinensis]